MPSSNTITSSQVPTFTPGTKARANEVNSAISTWRGHNLPVDPNTSSSAHNTYDLGASDAYWRTVYTGALDLRTSTTTATLLIQGQTSNTLGAIDVLIEGSTVGCFKSDGFDGSRIRPTSVTMGSLATKLEMVSFTATGSWTVPAYVNVITVIGIGGGGGGGGGSKGNAGTAGAGGGGGSSGFYGRFSFAVTPLSVLSITVGNGGAGGAGESVSASVVGSTGGSTSIVINGNTYSFKGGNPGNRSTDLNTAGTNSGNDGTETFPTLSVNGNAGALQQQPGGSGSGTFGTSGGSGGSSAAGYGGGGGGGGASVYGNGGAGGNGNNAGGTGSAGSTPTANTGAGGGGGGGGGTLGNGGGGAAGASGFLRIIY